jgi:hypothetical protein
MTMALFVGLVAVGAGIWAWQQWGVPAGLAALVLTFPVLTLIVGGIGLLIPGRKDRYAFVKAFEERGGRMGFDRGATNAQANRLYWQWKEEGGGLSASEWLDQKDQKRGVHPSSSPEGRGSPPHANSRITSPWRYEVIEWPPEDPKGFTASRWFDYERVGPLGSAVGLRHHQYCAHTHPTEEEAEPCLIDFRGLSGAPSANDVDGADSGLVWRTGHDGTASWTVGPIKLGLRLGNSVIPWPDIAGVVWRSGAVSFMLTPGLFTDSGTGEQVPVRLIQVEDLGDAQPSWVRYIDELGLNVPIDRE